MSEAGIILRPPLDRPRVPPELILRLQKYRDLARVPRVIRLAAEDIASEASRLAAPASAIWRGPLTKVEPGGAVTVAGMHHFHSRTLARLLAGASEVLVLVLTIGTGIEDRAREMLAGNLLMEGVLMDTAGWAALELVSRSLRLSLAAAEGRHGRVLTPRTAPGYQDWGLEEQATLFQVFGDAALPVTLTEAACMLPRKSISGVFGVKSVHRGDRGER